MLDRTVRLYAFSSPATTRIVGVLEPGTHYTGTRTQDFFANYATNDHYLSATMQDARAHRMTDVFARLREGQTVEAAQSELLSLNRALQEQYPEAYPERLGFTVSATRWQDELTRDARPTLLIRRALHLLRGARSPHRRDRCSRCARLHREPTHA